MRNFTSSFLARSSALFTALLSRNLSLRKPSLQPAHPIAPAAKRATTPARPSAESLRATAEAAAADPTFLLAPEPPSPSPTSPSPATAWPTTPTAPVPAAATGPILMPRPFAPKPSSTPRSRPQGSPRHPETSSRSRHRRDLALLLPARRSTRTTATSPVCSKPGSSPPRPPSLSPAPFASSTTARALGIEVFFLTGRGAYTGNDQTETTARNLTNAGYKGWKALILRNESERQISTTDYKASERAKIVAQGYKIILNMGDQWSDLNGNPKAEISVKLPNPFYYLP